MFCQLFLAVIILVDINDGVIAGIQLMYGLFHAGEDLFVRHGFGVWHQDVENDVGVGRTLYDAEIMKIQRAVELMQQSGDRFLQRLCLLVIVHDRIHVDDGVALAKKYKIPQVVVDFILSHHGTTRTEYFYNVFVNNGGDPERVSEFQYHGFKPKTKEQVIVMFADTVEAASRSLKNYSEQSVRELVDNVVKMKIDDGQLLDADISLKEISVLKSVLVEYLMQINHARIAYPKRQQK